MNAIHFSMLLLGQKSQTRSNTPGSGRGPDTAEAQQGQAVQSSPLYTVLNPIFWNFHHIYTVLCTRKTESPSVEEKKFRIFVYNPILKLGTVIICY